MIPDFTQSIFLRSLDEYGAYRLKFTALPRDEQAQFLKGQGFASLHDILAHIGVWWEEAEGIIRDTIDNRERPRRKYDFDEFNAASIARFKDTPETEFFDWYEAQRQKMIALVSSLTTDQMQIRRIPGWLDAVTLLHLKEHGIDAPRFLTLDMLQREWAAYLAQFEELSEPEQKAFLEKQGFPRFRDLVAHIIGWWEDGLQLIDATSKDPSYRASARDTNGFNADLVNLFGALDEAAVWKKYESTRQALIELVINLPEETYEHKEVQAWLKSDVIEHYFDHAL